VLRMLPPTAVFASLAAKSALLLQGPPGVGKTAVVEAAAKTIGQRVVRINFSASTSPEQLFGSIMPLMDSSGNRVFEWRNGALLEGILTGAWLLLDEINLASAEVLEVLAPLLRPSTAEFPIPGKGQSIHFSEIATVAQMNLDGTIIEPPPDADGLTKVRRPVILATMNPASIGGGRTRLPRSIMSLFTSVMLESYELDDLRQIFRDALVKQELMAKTPEEEMGSWFPISQWLMDRTFEVHKEVCDLVEKRSIGRGGGPFEFNLRSLSHLMHVVRGNAKNLQDHYKYASKSEAGDEQYDARTLALNKFMELTYGRRFQTIEDQIVVRKLINRSDRLAVTGEVKEVDEPIDQSVPNMLRVGTVYVPIGSQQLEQRQDSNLVHSPETVCTLEALAAAVQSKPPRAVLLEGDTASGKTEVVKEFARICRQELIIMSMTEETEVSELMGRWLPTKHSSDHDLLSDATKTIAQAGNLMLVQLYPLLASEEGRMMEEQAGGQVERLGAPDAAGLRHQMEEFMSLALRCAHPKYSGQLVDQIPELCNELVELGRRLSHLKYCIIDDEEAQARVSRRMNRLCDNAKQFVKKLSQDGDQATRGSSGVQVEFVPSPLVMAMQEGHWVLLDNVNSAPPEVIERLNSLFEEQPTLTLLEGGKGHIDIDPGFRIFTTANMQRANSNHLSAAFLNRVIRIWLPPLDSRLLGRARELRQQDLQETEAFAIISTKLSELKVFSAGKWRLTMVLLSFHAHIKYKVLVKEITMAAAAQLTFRFMLNT
jgi:midasin (ATPase involved in ribosome maturation)